MGLSQDTIAARVQVCNVTYVEFYERQRKGITLTPAGKSFLIDARRILENCEASIRKAQRISRGRDWGIGHWLYVGAVARFFG